MDVPSWSVGVDWLTSVLLGVLVALDPCTLATSFTAIGYIGKNQERHRVLLGGLFYALGRCVTYFTLGALLAPLIRKGLSTLHVEELLLRWGGGLIGPLMVLVGVLLLLSRYIQLPGIVRVSDGVVKRLTYHRGWGAFLLGVLFSLAICPSIAIAFFGIQLPLVVHAGGVRGVFLLLLFSLFTALPVGIMAWVLAYSVSRVGAYYKVMSKVRRWLNVAMAVLFIVAGAQMMVESYGLHNHHEHHHEQEQEESPCRICSGYHLLFRINLSSVIA